MNLGTAFVLLVVIAVVALALRSVLKKGSCGCGGSSDKGGCEGCTGCSCGADCSLCQGLQGVDFDGVASMKPSAISGR